MEKLRNTRCEIDLDKLRGNINAMKKLVGDKVTPMAIIKADAYGHGAAIIMKYMLKYGISQFGVASLNEAVELRRTNKEGEILVLGYTPDEMLHYVAENNLTQTIFSLQQAKVLSALNKNAKIQIKFDSGMHRLGYHHTAEAIDEVEQIAKLPSLQILGCYTHLALKDKENDDIQFARFNKFLDACAQRGVKFPFTHICDGIGTVDYPEMRMNMVRPGSFFYGWNLQVPGVEPIMTMKSEIAHLQVVPAGEGVGYSMREPVDYDRVMATLPFGYVDGCPRAMSKHKGWVGIHGQRAEFCSLLCMDMSMVDVTDIKDVKVGDEVVIFGEEGGGMTYRQGAEIADFNRNGLQAAVARRVPKVYIENGKVVDYVDYLL